MARLAIATERQQVAQHFGHCSEYTLVESENGTVKGRSTIPCPAHEPCTLPSYLAELGVTCVVAGGMGARAQEGFARCGIQTFVGVSGSVDTVIQAWLRGELISGDGACGREGCGAH